LSFLDDAIAAQPTVANRKSVLQSGRLFRHCQVNATEITLNYGFDKKSCGIGTFDLNELERHQPTVF
jgi:hypothetical protein